MQKPKKSRWHACWRPTDRHTDRHDDDSQVWLARKCEQSGQKRDWKISPLTWVSGLYIRKVWSVIFSRLVFFALSTKRSVRYHGRARKKGFKHHPWKTDEEAAAASTTGGFKSEKQRSRSFNSEGGEAFRSRMFRSLSPMIGTAVVKRL